MPQTQIDEIRRVMPTSPLKLLAEYDMEHEIYIRQINDTPKTLEELHFQRGIREGLNIAKGILNRKPKS